MICMNEAASDKRSDQHIDTTKRDSKRSDVEATTIARQLENDDLGGVSCPEGDDAAENKVETSLDEDW